MGFSRERADLCLNWCHHLLSQEQMLGKLRAIYQVLIGVTICYRRNALDYHKFCHYSIGR